ncbi:HemK family protein methyltransferase, partial [bacterium]|nr:HemK family protein methyltransferase [bacterium]
AGVDSPWLDAEILLAEALCWPRERLLARGREEIPPGAAARWEALLVRREAREPVDRILGRRAFRCLRLEVVPGVFSPRPETEELVERARRRAPAGGRLLDLCCGGGCIGICLLAETDLAGAVLVDADPRAVAHARAEAARLLPAADLDVREGDLYAPVAGEMFDLVVCNPPYVALSERGGLAPEVLAHDPAASLFSPDGPLGVAARVVADAPRHLRPGGWLLLEVGLCRGEEAVGLFGEGWAGVAQKKPWGSAPDTPAWVVEARWNP